MFTIEFKINGGEICRITGQNKGFIDAKNCEYDYEFYEWHKEVQRGSVTFERQKGMLQLAKTIITDLIKKQKVT